MISEDKENMWTSNLLKKSNNDNSAVVVAFASNNNIKQHQTQFKYKISYKKSWKLKNSISEKKQTNVINARPFIKGLR